MSISNNLHFINGEWSIVAILTGILLLMLYGWKEWKGYSNKLFWINLVVAAIGLASLLLLFLRPTWPVTVNKDGIILTEGYSKKQLDSITTSSKRLKIINYKLGDDLSGELDSLSGVTILGQGLKPFDFWQLKDKTISYLPIIKVKGISRLKYEPNNFLGGDLIVNGEYMEPAAGHQLLLQNAGGVTLDSVVLKNEDSFLFRLKTNLKSVGKYVYQLTEKDSMGDILYSEPLPIIVNEPVIGKILMIDQFPSFETKYLKNFLAAEGHEVTVRSQITKRKYKFEYFNTDSNPVYSLSEAVLADYDLLILDERTYASISSNKNSSLMKSINNGLGVFLQPGEWLFQAKIKLPEVKFVSDKSSKIALPKTRIKVEKYPYKFVHNSFKGFGLEGFGYVVIHGNGKYGTSILKNTYQLILKGKDDSYKEIWTSIVEKLLKSKERAGVVETSQSLIFQDRPFEFSVVTEEEKPIVMHSDGFQVPLVKDVTISNKWHGINYARYTGWNTIYLASDSTLFLNYFVLDSLKWKTLDAIQTRDENQRFFNKNISEYPVKKIPKEIERFWFFLIAVLCMCYLWLSPKLIKS